MESPKPSELKPEVFLYGPSKSEAIRLGLGNWFERLSSHEQVTTVEDLDLVEEGIFISFNPIRSREDAFPELGERVRRWICIEDDDSFVEGCRIAKKEGVDRLIHTRLIDEMRCPVIPSAILLLVERGIWLPDTEFEEAARPFDGSIKLGPIKDRNLWFICEKGGSGGPGSCGSPQSV